MSVTLVGCARGSAASGRGHLFQRDIDCAYRDPVVDGIAPIRISSLVVINSIIDLAALAARRVVVIVLGRYVMGGWAISRWAVNACMGSLGHRQISACRR